jgi:hypothetical protein
LTSPALAAKADIGLVATRLKLAQVRSRSATIARRSLMATITFSSRPKVSSAPSSTPIPGSPAGAA